MLLCEILAGEVGEGFADGVHFQQQTFRESFGRQRASLHSWQDVLDDGLVRAIGICDVDEPLLEELLQQRQKPHIIQNWCLT